MIRTLAFGLGLAAGVKVTRRLHDDPAPGRWGERLGRTRLRYANLPVGGTIAIAAAPLLPARVGRATRALGVGALVGAVGWGLVDPLPPLAYAHAAPPSA
jgi:hypothetical protein